MLAVFGNSLEVLKGLRSDGRAEGLVFFQLPEKRDSIGGTIKRLISITEVI